MKWGEKWTGTYRCSQERVWAAHLGGLCLPEPAVCAVSGTLSFSAPKSWGLCTRWGGWGEATHWPPVNCSLCACSVVSDSSQPRGLLPARVLRSRDFPGKNTGVGCKFLFQGIFPTQIEPVSPALAGRFFCHCTTWEAQIAPYFAIKKKKKVLFSNFLNDQTIKVTSSLFLDSSFSFTQLYYKFLCTTF